jgi:His Kinase A (phospho-acceptor) domain
LRFDDRLSTTLRHSLETSASASIRWRQLIDILSQNPKNFAASVVADGLLHARKLLPHTDPVERLASVKSLTGRIQSAPLVQLLAADLAPISAAAISGARLSDVQWADIVPHLPVRARGFLRNRSDLGPLARRALWAWSSADFVLPNLTQQNAAQQILTQDAQSQTANDPAPANMQIRDIVERIERLRRDREIAPTEPMAAPEIATENNDAPQYCEPVHEIQFETDDMGTVSWAKGAPRGAIVGVGIAEPAFDNGPGPDAYGASAFRQRMPLENARMRLMGAPIIDGDWRINAAPFFDPASGRFRGYRGIFRRPNVAESPEISRIEQNEGDRLQQLVHELRTPLGAIIGFSEIIEQQLFGPVSAEYRTLARNILNDAGQLLSGFDDLAMAAKIESGRLVAAPGITECAWLATRLADRLHGLSETLSVTLNLAKADPVRPFAIDNEMTERLFSRLLSAVIIGCEPGEELNGRFRTELGNRAMNSFNLSLPTKLCGLTEQQLLGSVSNQLENKEDVSLLGLGFSLRLVRNLAKNVGGDLRFQKESLLLLLPASHDTGLHFRGEEKE